jgi:acyl carrier protein
MSTLEKISQLMSHISQQPIESVTEKKPLEDYVLESLQAVEFLASIEKDFGVPIALGDLFKCKNLGDVCAFVDKKQKRK